MTTTSVDWTSVKADFPIFEQCTDSGRLVYLDSANTSQKPRSVISAMDSFLRHDYGPINRSAYRLAAAATESYEAARNKVARFINARLTHEVIFTKNATESLNLIVSTWARQNLKSGDVVVLTHMEHHANIVPWHMLAAERGIVLRWVPLTPDGELDTSSLSDLLKGARIFSFTAMSNVLGTINPVAELCRAAHDAGALAIVDACQSVPHSITDVQLWDADFVAFSGHKMVGPTGIGVLWGREELLDAMPPFLGGGNMIADVRLDGFTCADLPAKFEAGTPPIVEAIGLGAAVDYLESIGMGNIRQHEMALISHAISTLTDRFGADITIHGPRNVEHRGAVLSFAFRDLHPHDISQILDEKNVCVRAGHHCAKPLMRLLGANATVRASFYLYNDESDALALADALESTSDIFGI